MARSSATRGKVEALVEHENTPPGERLAAVAALDRISLPAVPAAPRLTLDAVMALAVPDAGSRVHYFSPGIVVDRRVQDGRKTVIESILVPRGFGVRITANGARSYLLNYSLKSIAGRVTLGRVGEVELLAAVTRARELREQINAGIDPAAAAAKAEVEAKRAAEREAANAVTTAGMLGAYVRDVLPLKAVSTRQNIEATFRLHVVPRIGHIKLVDLKRIDVLELVRALAVTQPSTAHRTLAYIGMALNSWREDHDFEAPRLRGIAKKLPAEVARERVLSDAEIRTLWHSLADVSPSYARLCKVLLLTTLRLREAAELKWSEVEADALVIAGTRRKNGAELVLPLTPAILAELGERPADAAARPYVFSTDGGRSPLAGFSNFKRQLDAAIARRGGFAEPWVIHDCRRTGVTLMQRLGVDAEVAERVAGHTVGSAVRRIYARHAFRVEKLDALERLGVLIAQLVAGGTP